MSAERTTTIRLTPTAYRKYQKFMQDHQKALELMGINNLSKLANWALNEGFPIVEEKIKKMEA